MISINYRDSRPIYEQIKDGVRKLILTGVLPKDGKLPSVRELASQLAINPNTIQRAYRDLETEGYIYTVSGKGSFASGTGDADEGRKRELLKSFDDIVHELSYFGVTPEKLAARLQSDVLEEKGEGLV